MPITYTLDIPDAPNNPSVDQGPMKVNTNAVDTIIAIDHYTFADAASGTHKQVTLSGKNAAGAQTDPTSTIYSASGVASTVSQLTYRNQNGIFPLSCVRAWATFAGASGGIISSESVNVVSVVRNSVGAYTVTVTANALSSVNYAVFITTTIAGAVTTIGPVYAITNATTFTINTRSPATGSSVDCTAVSFMVLQI